MDSDKKQNFLLKNYDKHYKPLMIISVLLLVFSLIIVGHKLLTTGDVVSKGVSLSGGLSIDIKFKEVVDPDAMQKYLKDKHPTADINVRSSIGQSGSSELTIEASSANVDDLIKTVKDKYPYITENDYSSNSDGPSLGNSFFKQTLKSIFIAFLFMSLVVYMYFGDSTKHKWLSAGLSLVSGLMMFYSNSVLLYAVSLLILAYLMYLYFTTSIPSFGIILCAFSDLFFSLAVFNLSGMKLNIGGVAAFLMLVGYSIDTDILLSVRVLKRREGSVFDRILGAMKTGVMMSVAALIASLTAYFFTSSDIIREIMFILSIGLFADMIFTWIQNAGILRWHLDRKGWK